jgi:hypothetical protein
MKAKLSILALALTAAVSAQAGTISIDDFSASQAAVFSPAPVTGPTLTPINSLVNSRTLGFSASGGTPSNGAYIQVDRGVLDINNGAGVSGTSTVKWDLNASAIQTAIGAATWVEVFITALSVDVNSVLLTPVVGGSARVTGPTTAPQNVLLFRGTAADLLALNPYTLSFASELNADSTWDNVSLRYSCTATGGAISDKDAMGTAACSNVPLPGSAALLGLGLVGFGALRRKIQK